MKFLLTALSLLLTTTVYAGGYGAAGCGLGSILFGNSRGFIQVFAATTNGTSGSQTFGITSGTSNCGSGGKSPTQFIEVNKAALSNDAARGHGETISALGTLYGCKDQSRFKQSLKKNFSSIFSEDKAEQINRRIINTLKKESLQCNEIA